MKSFMAVYVATLAVSITPVWGIWQEGDYCMMEDAPLPDLTSGGMDVDTTQYTLADDFYTSGAGNVAHVYIWGSWLNDILPGGDAGNVTFELGFHDNATVEGPYGPENKPGTMLMFSIFEAYDGQQEDSYFTVSQYATDLDEGWLNPSTGNHTASADTVCWVYDFYVGEEAMPLEYDEHYWITLRAFPAEQGASFGWKTATEVLNSWSQWSHSTEPINDPADWVTTYYGGGVPLCFVVAPEPGTLFFLIVGTGWFFFRRRF